MSQETQILSHLKRGPIDPMKALTLNGCFRLAARISDLRDKGHDIRTQIIERDGKRFAKYWLNKKPPIREERGLRVDLKG